MDIILSNIGKTMSFRSKIRQQKNIGEIAMSDVEGEIIVSSQRMLE
jgi:hypothetical protein